MTRQDRVQLVIMAALLAIGFYLRLYQFTDQVLLDDEWHAVHQLLAGLSPAEMFFNFGHADYSIPLGMLYWLESRWFGLDELVMRWPMLLAGLGLLAGFAWYTWRRFSPRIAIIATLMLALSPMLVIYSHTARPYALTLFLSYLGLFAFYRYLSAESRSLRWGACYGACAAMAIWLHPVTAPFMAAPFLAEGLRSLAARRPRDLGKLACLGAPVALAVLALILPPLLAAPEKLSAKMGQAVIDGDTFWGVWFFWLATPSAILNVLLTGLFLAGLGRMLKTDPLWQGALAGLLLAALVIVVAQPASTGHPGTFGRYLLPATPMILLGIACGVDGLLARARALRWPVGLLSAAMLGAWVFHSPTWDFLYRPNSNITHSRFQAEFRPRMNVVVNYQEMALPISRYWKGLANEPPDSMLVAVAPFYFETYHWDGPRWEQIGRQRIVPAWLTGFCAEKRSGETPPNSNYRFRNAFYLAELGEPGGGRPDWLVFNQPLKGFEGSPEGEAMAAEAGRCIPKLRAALGEPDYEDEVLMAWNLAGS